jgi:hypothetical protein
MTTSISVEGDVLDLLHMRPHCECGAILVAEEREALRWSELEAHTAVSQILFTTLLPPAFETPAVVW